MNFPGLRLSWFVYRGAGTVTFDPEQTKVWQDTRPDANSMGAVLGASAGTCGWKVGGAAGVLR